jgi:hypothetical protein
MPLGLVFRKAVLWHGGEKTVFRNLREKQSGEFGWEFEASTRDGARIRAAFDGSGPSLHRLPYLMTDCSGTFEVRNNSLARASVCLERPGSARQAMETDTGAVLEMAG